MCDCIEEKISFYAKSNEVKNKMENILKVQEFFCATCDSARNSSDKYLQRNKKLKKSPFSIEFSFSRLRMSNIKAKPLIRKSKLRLLGCQIYSELKIVHNGIKEQSIGSKIAKKSSYGINQFGECGTVLNNSSTLNQIYLKTSSDFKLVFDKSKESSFMLDFKSLSPKENINSSQNSFDPAQFSDLGCRHRGDQTPSNLKPKKKCRKRLVDSELPDLNSLSLSETSCPELTLTCAEQARNYEEITTDELAAYLDNYLHFPKKMSHMAEMMYT